MNCQCLHTIYRRVVCAQIHHANDCVYCQHFGEQQFRDTVMCSCAHYTIFSVEKLDLCIRALLLDHILALKKKTTRTPRVHLVNYGAAYTGYSCIATVQNRACQCFIGIGKYALVTIINNNS